MKLADLSNAQLLESLTSLRGQDRAVLARMLAHLGEVESRRLHLEAACPSMFQFCTPDGLATIPIQTILREALAVLT